MGGPGPASVPRLVLGTTGGNEDVIPQQRGVDVGAWDHLNRG